MSLSNDNPASLTEGELERWQRRVKAARQRIAEEQLNLRIAQAVVKELTAREVSTQEGPYHLRQPFADIVYAAMLQLPVGKRFTAPELYALMTEAEPLLRGLYSQTDVNNRLRWFCPRKGKTKHRRRLGIRKVHDGQRGRAGRKALYERVDEREDDEAAP